MANGIQAGAEGHNLKRFPGLRSAIRKSRIAVHEQSSPGDLRVRYHDFTVLPLWMKFGILEQLYKIVPVMGFNFVLLQTKVSKASSIWSRRTVREEPRLVEAELDGSVRLRLGRLRRRVGNRASSLAGGGSRKICRGSWEGSHGGTGRRTEGLVRNREENGDVWSRLENSAGFCEASFEERMVKCKTNVRNEKYAGRVLRIGDGREKQGPW
eukprot:5980881-Pleurochrysis_carterae.AAC.1